MAAKKQGVKKTKASRAAVKKVKKNVKKPGIGVFYSTDIDVELK